MPDLGAEHLEPGADREDGTSSSIHSRRRGPDARSQGSTASTALKGPFPMTTRSASAGSGVAPSTLDDLRLEAGELEPATEHERVAPITGHREGRRMQLNDPERRHRPAPPRATSRSP